jgi:hypothetical protein
MWVTERNRGSEFEKNTPLRKRVLMRMLSRFDAFSGKGFALQRVSSLERMYQYYYWSAGDALSRPRRASILRAAKWVRRVSAWERQQLSLTYFNKSAVLYGKIQGSVDESCIGE